LTGHGLDVAWSGRHAIVTMPEEIDLVNSAGVREQLAAVAGQAPDVITIDMTSTKFCDSAGIQVLTRVRELAAAGGSEMRIAVGRSPVARILQLTGLDQFMPTYRDVQQSLDTPRDRA
jgi:anti-sigma B factor antagonist